MSELKVEGLVGRKQRQGKKKRKNEPSIQVILVYSFSSLTNRREFCSGSQYEPRSKTVFLLPPLQLVMAKSFQVGLLGKPFKMDRHG